MAHFSALPSCSLVWSFATCFIPYQALQSGSKDNLSCMIVALGGGEGGGLDKELIPGPFDAPRHAGFRKAYAAMVDVVKHGINMWCVCPIRSDSVSVIL